VAVVQVPQNIQLSLDLVKVHGWVLLLTLCRSLLGLLVLLRLLLLLVLLLLLLLLQSSQEERVDVCLRRNSRLERIRLRESLCEGELEGELSGRCALRGLRLLLGRVLLCVLLSKLLIPSERLGHAVSRLLLLLLLLLLLRELLLLRVGRLAVGGLLVLRSLCGLRVRGASALLVRPTVLVLLPRSASSCTTSATTSPAAAVSTSATASASTETRSTTLNGCFLGTHHLVEVLRASKRCVTFFTSLIIVKF